jgi:tryptophan 2,3-dioxygenase
MEKMLWASSISYPLDANTRVFKMTNISDDDLQDAWDLYEDLCRKIDEEHPNLTCTFVALTGVMRHIGQKTGMPVEAVVEYFEETIKIWDLNE